MIHYRDDVLTTSFSTIDHEVGIGELSKVYIAVRAVRGGFVDERKTKHQTTLLETLPYLMPGSLVYW